MRHHESSGTTSRARAARFLRERIGQREAGKIIGRPDRVTFTNLATALERDYEVVGNSSLVRAKQALEHLDQFLGAETPALAITRQRVGEYLQHRFREKAARATVRYEIAVLNTLFTVGVKEELLAVRPMFKLPVVENTREGFFEPADFAALVVELPDYVRPLIRFLPAVLLATGT
jgi:hypothetical protein